MNEHLESPVPLISGKDHFTNHQVQSSPPVTPAAAHHQNCATGDTKVTRRTKGVTVTMIIQAHALLALLATVACADGILLRRNTQDAHSPMSGLSPTTNDAFANTQNPHPPVATLPSTTNNVITTTQDAYPPTGTSPSTEIDAITTTEAPHPPMHSSFFTTDAMTSSNILILPGNETVSRLLFWPPSPGINVTLNITVAHRNYTFNVPTALAQHWHSIDIYQPTARSSKTLLYLHTDGRYINLNHSRVIQMQVGSDHPTHWCFCPSAHLCTLLSPLEYGGGDSSGERTDLLAALLVVVFLLIVTLLALGGVTFYRKNELFHIYAKPIDCLPYTSPPPPLPKPNKESALHGDGGEAKQVEADKTDQTDDSGYSKVSRGANKADPPIPPVTKPAYDKIYKQPQEHESINSLYGLV